MGRGVHAIQSRKMSRRRIRDTFLCAFAVLGGATEYTTPLVGVLV
jgi:hypothetical protein